MQPRTIASLVGEFLAGDRSRQSVISECLERIHDLNGEGHRVFLKSYDEEALEAARQYDQWQGEGRRLPPFAGVPVSIKDLFDVRGEATPAGSRLLMSQAPAKQDSPAVARLREAGFIPIGRTNMSEFAFSGLGLNPHFGTPLNAYDRKHGRIPGGSTSGGAVSVSDGMATVALGTDTGGSCRIPAALSGLVGFKPTARRIPMDGMVPLSTSLDSVGSIGHSVDCVAAVDAVLARTSFELEIAPVTGVRVGMLTSYVVDDMDAATARAYSALLTRLSALGLEIADLPVPELNDIPNINAKGGFPAAEAYRYHAKWLETRANEYDPRVLSRILRGKLMSDDDYRALQNARAGFIRSVTERVQGFDVLLMPTVPVVAPTIQSLEDEADFTRVNLLMLRNSTVVNLLDWCAISLPCHNPGEAPVGFTMIGKHGEDRRLLSLARSIERALAGNS